MRRNLPSQIIKSTLKAAIPFLALMGMADFAQAQSGYNYRTVKSSNWNDITLWERASFSNPNSYSSIVSSAEIPNRNSGNIEILDGHTVTYDYANNVDQIIVKPGGVFELPSGRTLYLYLAPSTDRLVVQGVNGKQGVFRNLGGSITYRDGVSTNLTSNIEVGAYGKYEHAYTGSVGTIPTATWDVNSEIEFKMTGPFAGVTLADYQTRGFNQAFGNVIWNTPTNTSLLDLKGVITNVQGNFEVVSTGTGVAGTSNSALVLSTSGTYNLAIGKSLIVSGANSDLVFSTQGAPTGGALNLTLGEGMQVSNSAYFRNNTVATPLKVLFNGGNLQNSSSQPNINYEIAPASSVTLTNDFSVGSSSSFVVKGTLKTGTNAVKGSGSFTLSNAATLNIGSPVGITTSGTTGNIQVSGTRTFSNLANYNYNGSVTQVTGIGLPALINELTINNPAGLTLSAPVTINGSLKMAEGVLTATTANKLIIASSGSVVMPPADKTSYISGPISCTIDNTNYNNFVTLQFPIGKNGKYRPVELSIFQFDPITTYYTAEQFEQPYASASPLPGSIDRISAVRYFNINKSSVAEVTAQIKLNYGSDDGVTNYQNLTIAKYNSVNKWVDILGTATANGSGTITSDLFDNFSDFVIANKTTGTNPLPVELINFTAKADKNAITLSWETASEKNNDRFEVERSLDGLNFEKIATVKGNGTTSQANTYSITDINPVLGLNYYRLKQVDLDGTFVYSQIVKAQLNEMAEQVNIYPNPAKDQITVVSKNAANLKITNVLGQVVYSQQFKNATEKVINITDLKPGVYNLTLESESGIRKQKFVKAGF